MPLSAAKTKRPSSRVVAHRSAGVQSPPQIRVVADGIGVVLDHDPVWTESGGREAQREGWWREVVGDRR
ncbi:hypothetical protein RCF19_31785 [Rhodococcus qingshengii]